MALARFLMWCASVMFFSAAAAGLAAYFGMVTIPRPVLPYWSWIPTFGTGLIGQIGCLVVAALIAYCMYTALHLVQTPAYGWR